MDRICQGQFRCLARIRLSRRKRLPDSADRQYSRPGALDFAQRVGKNRVHNVCGRDAWAHDGNLFVAALLGANRRAKLLFRHTSVTVVEQA